MKKIIDYCVITMEVETDFFGAPLPDQSRFNNAVKRKLVEGFELKDELKTTQGAKGFWSSDYPTISQALVKYEP